MSWRQLREREKDWIGIQSERKGLCPHLSTPLPLLLLLLHIFFSSNREKWVKNVRQRAIWQTQGMCYFVCDVCGCLCVRSFFHSVFIVAGMPLKVFVLEWLLVCICGYFHVWYVIFLCFCFILWFGLAWRFFVVLFCQRCKQIEFRSQ